MQRRPIAPGSICFIAAGVAHSFLGTGPRPATCLALDFELEEVEAQLGAFIEDLGLTDVMTHGVPPGLRPERLTPSLERFAREVMPGLRTRFDG